MGESRTELLQWMNELLQINYTKIEQCGSGAAYCQIMDSVYGDIPMTRVKMNAKQEYEYLTNFKVLQTVFKNKKIDKPIPVEKLVKCKMQDNLEFIQWIKRFWETNYPGHPYDPVARRKGAPMEVPATVATIKSTSKPSARLTPGAASGTRTPVSGHRTGSAMGGQVVALQNQLTDLREQMDGLEKERDFYFAKLRDIEILIQEKATVDEAGAPTDELLRQIQEILYMTEEGFAPPEADEEETF